MKTKDTPEGLRHVLGLLELNQRIAADAIKVYREMIATKVQSRREGAKRIAEMKAKLRALTPARRRA